MILIAFHETKLFSKLKTIVTRLSNITSICRFHISKFGIHIIFDNGSIFIRKKFNTSFQFDISLIDFQKVLRNITSTDTCTLEYEPKTSFLCIETQGKKSNNKTIKIQAADSYMTIHEGHYYENLHMLDIKYIHPSKGVSFEITPLYYSLEKLKQIFTKATMLFKKDKLVIQSENEELSGFCSVPISSSIFQGFEINTTHQQLSHMLWLANSISTHMYCTLHTVSFKHMWVSSHDEDGIYLIWDCESAPACTA